MATEDEAWDAEKAGKAWERYLSEMAQSGPPIARDLLDGLGIDDPTQEQLQVIGEALGRAYLAGVQTGETEAIAQAIEQGVNVKVHKRPPEPPED